MKEIYCMILLLIFSVSCRIINNTPQPNQKNESNLKEYVFLEFDSTVLDKHFIFFIQVVGEKDTLKLFSPIIDNVNCINVISMQQKYKIHLDTLKAMPINGEDYLNYFGRGVVLSDEKNEKQLVIKAGEYIFTSPNVSGMCYLK